MNHWIILKNCHIFTCVYCLLMRIWILQHRFSYELLCSYNIIEKVSYTNNAQITLLCRRESACSWLFLGLLTVDPKRRLTIVDVKRNVWLFPESVPQTPLMTPDVLAGSRSMLGFQINATLNAFNKAAKAGFKLNAVSKAPLAQRRKNKKSSTSSGDSR